jgi:hypothetical protein
MYEKSARKHTRLMLVPSDFLWGFLWLCFTHPGRHILLGSAAPVFGRHVLLGLRDTEAAQLCVSQILSER